MNAIKSKGVFLHILLALTLVFCAQNNAKSTEESSCQSHDHGVSDTCAQYNLGVMYRDGEGVPQDYVRAYMWFNVAAIKDEGAAERRESLAALMTAEQIAEAQRLSSAFVSALESEQE